MSDDFWGVNLRDFVIGVQGSVSGVFVLRNFKPLNIISHVVVGGFTANYLHVVVEALWPFHTVAHDTAVYLAGLIGIAMSLGFLKATSLWTQRMVK
jgi:hypothetical protein